MNKHNMSTRKLNKKHGFGEIDWVITLLPLVIVSGIAALLLTFPQQSMKVIDTLWNIFVNKLGFFYILLGFGLVCTAFYLAFSKCGAIRLGSLDKPRYSNFTWGSMIFTSTMAADILYWSLIEWGYYYTASPFGQTALTAAERQDWAAAYPLFHWGITPWSFHIVCAVAFGYMLHVRQRKKQKLSEACRPLFGNKIDGMLGTVIDVFSVVGLLAGTATTFSLATPLLSLAISTISGIPESRELTLVVLCIIAAVYTSAVLLGIKGISHLAKIAVVCFSSLIVFVFLLSPKLYIIETSITGIGKMLQNFILLSTWMDPCGFRAQTAQDSRSSGRFFIGHIGLHGLLQRRSLSEQSLKGGRYGIPYWAGLCAASQEPIARLSYWETTGFIWKRMDYYRQPSGLQRASLLPRLF